MEQEVFILVSERGEIFANNTRVLALMLANMLDDVVVNAGCQDSTSSCATAQTMLDGPTSRPSKQHQQDAAQHHERYFSLPPLLLGARRAQEILDSSSAEHQTGLERWQPYAHGPWKERRDAGGRTLSTELYI